MTKTLTSTLATLALTIVMSATCVFTAVGPATPKGEAAVASAARFVA